MNVSIVTRGGDDPDEVGQLDELSSWNVPRAMDSYADTVV